MEGAGKLVEDEELRNAMSAKGLGTPATRAAIIEGLILGRLHRTPRARTERDAEGNVPDRAPARHRCRCPCARRRLTGEWESKLKLMEQGGLQRKDFMAQIRVLTEDIVSKAKNFQGDTVEGDFGELDAACPEVRHPAFEGRIPGFSLPKLRLRVLEVDGGSSV